LSIIDLVLLYALATNGSYKNSSRLRGTPLSG